MHGPVVCTSKVGKRPPQECGPESLEAPAAGFEGEAAHLEQEGGTGFNQACLSRLSPHGCIYIDGPAGTVPTERDLLNKDACL